MCGEPFVMTTGPLLMPMQLADSWAILEQVSNNLCTYYSLKATGCNCCSGEFQTDVYNEHFLSPDAIAYSGAYFGLGSGPIHLDDVRCTGSEAALINCTYDPITSDCSHYEDAGVQCGKNTQTSFTIYILYFLQKIIYYYFASVLK